jgi:succinyl-CoA synthetase beta subunit
MDADALLEAARRRGSRTLNEHESKRFLAAFGIPSPKEMPAADEAAAVRAAEAMGYPVAVKALGAAFAHKTEAGLVHLNLADPRAVHEACRRIRRCADERDLEGFLIQPQLQGRRELLAGLFTDPQFGPVVMLGLGGVFTEVFSDVSLRLAPLTEVDAGEMIDALRSSAVLGAFRGEAAADRPQLRQILLALSRIALSCPDVSEIDINPIIVSPDGTAQIADALVIAGGRPAGRPAPAPVAPDRLGNFFHPRCFSFVLCFL